MAKSVPSTLNGCTYYFYGVYLFLDMVNYLHKTDNTESEETKALLSLTNSPWQVTNNKRTI